MPESAWEQTKKYSGSAYDKAIRPGFDKVSLAVDRLGHPVNRLSHKVGAEAFWPTSLDKECDKAARIIRSFCRDGFYAELDKQQQPSSPTSDGRLASPQGKQRVLKKIPEKVVRDAKGLAIFTTARAGFWVSGAGGSGVILARDPETGEWGAPSGIMVHTIGLGLLIGVNIYDCVVIINTYKALEAFTKTRCTLGGEISAVAGPIGVGGVVDSEVHQRQAPIFTYLKSRGFYAGVQVDGTIVSERADENEIFYGERITAAAILAGEASNPPRAQYRMLIETIRAAQGDKVDEDSLPAPGQNPGDMEYDADDTQFGIPDLEDPDPYGVKALEAEGLEIREAGSLRKPSADIFEFKPAFTSPIFSEFRKSADYREKAKSWRGSISMKSVDRGTQTEEDFSNVPYQPLSKIPLPSSPLRKETEPVEESADESQMARIRSPVSPPSPISRDSPVSPVTPDFALHDEPAQIETAIPVIARAVVVNVPKRVPPALPLRNPRRDSPSKRDNVDGFEPVSASDANYSDRFERDMRTPEFIQRQDTREENANASSRDGAWTNEKHDGTVVATEDEFHSVPPSPTKESPKTPPRAH